MNKVQKDLEKLGNANLKKLLWKLAIPSIVTQLVTMIYNIVDRIYIGHIENVGGLAITGLGVCTPLVIIIAAFSQLICCGGAPIASAELGQKNEKNAVKSASTSFLVLLICSIILTVLLRKYDEPLLYLFGASTDSMPYAKLYMDTYVLGTICNLISTGMNFYIVAQGKTLVSMVAISSGAILNIALDPVFIWGADLGIQGAAIATIVSQTVSALIVITFLFGKKSVIRMSFKDLQISLLLLKKSILLGLSPFVMQITESALAVAFNKSLLQYGGDVAVGAMSLFTSINSLVFLPICGLCQGAQPITSYNLGAGKLDRVSENIKRLIRTCMLYTTGIWMLLMLFPGMFLQLFTKDEAILSYGMANIRVFFGMTFVIGIQVSCQNSFLALKNAKASLLLALLRKVFLLIPLIFILPCFIVPLDFAVFLAEPVADTIAATVTAITFYCVNRDRIFRVNRLPK